MRESLPLRRAAYAAALLLLAAAVPPAQADTHTEDIRADHLLGEAEIIAIEEGPAEAYRYLGSHGELSDQSVVLFARGHYAWQADMVPEAEEAYRILLEREPDNPWYLNALGYLLADKNYQVDEAQELLGRALRLAPDTPEIIDSYGWALYRLGDLPAAIEYIERAMEYYGYETPPAEMMAHYGELLWETGDSEGAIIVWRNAWEAAPDDPYLLATIERYADSYPVR